MRVRTEVTGEKLRGGFYSPEALVTVCLDRVAALLGTRDGLRLLEPSAGDGAFLRGLAKHPLATRIDRAVAVELVPEEADKARAAHAAAGFRGVVVPGSFLQWVSTSSEQFDVAVGNPPFVRYQFIAPEDAAALPAVSEQIGLSLGGVSNLWIPILLGALNHLSIGGAFAFIVPAECLTGVSAGKLRAWLTSNTAQLQIDLFPAGSFPRVLQEVIVLSGVRTGSEALTALLSVVEHFSDGRELRWTHDIGGHPTWTRHLLEPAQLIALEAAMQLPAVSPLGRLAKFEVAAVTGANDYFCVDDATREAFGLAKWTRPLLPRTRWAKGLVYTRGDYDATREGGAKAHLLDFAAKRPDPRLELGPGMYLDLGTSVGIHERYKCRIRVPWYRVPHVRAGSLMLSKRCHRFPRVILNEAMVVTTDTIYRGDMVPGQTEHLRDLVGGFHNSLTLLSAELEGRSFGGGVLELVPTEIARLRVPLVQGFGAHLATLDSEARATSLAADGEALVDATDRLMARAGVGLDLGTLAVLREARLALVRRRMDRN